MSKNSEIGWTHHTANPWWGCVKVSPACDHCYAAVISARLSRSLFGHSVAWGPGAEQGHKMEELEREAPRWDRAAAREGEQHRVFCGSMCDWAEGRADQKPSLARLFPLIERTPHLAWLLLTKRPNIGKRLLSEAYRTALPPNIWVGSTVENQAWADHRLPHLLSIDAAIRFVSVEPQLGHVELRPHLGPGLGKVNWVICGGESGPQARGSDEVLGWYRSLRDQCLETGAQFFFKQWGRFRQEGDTLIKLRGKNPDNTLDGVRWEQYPTPSGPPVDEQNRSSPWRSERS